MKVFNATRGSVLVERGWMATNLFARARGLLWHPPLQVAEGLYIAPCHSIHTWFMGFAIDAAFLDRDGKVLHTIPDMAPGHISPHLLKAQGVLELPAGTLAASGTQLGDTLSILA